MKIDLQRNKSVLLEHIYVRATHKLDYGAFAKYCRYTFRPTFAFAVFHREVC